MIESVCGPAGGSTPLIIVYLYSFTHSDPPQPGSCGVLIPVNLGVGSRLGGSQTISLIPDPKAINLRVAFRTDSLKNS